MTFEFEMATKIRQLEKQMRFVMGLESLAGFEQEPSEQINANGTVLDIGAIADGNHLRRSGTNVIGHDLIGYIASQISAADNFAPVPACRVYRTTTQSIPNNTWTAISFGKEEFDTDTMHSISTNPERITIRTAGIYQINGTVSFAGNASGIRAACITYNGTTIPDNGIVFCSQAGNATANHLPPLSVIKSCAATDILRFYVYQNSGGALGVTVSTITPFFSAVYQGSAS